MKMKCPHCGVSGSVSDSLLGKRVRCPKCKEIFRVTTTATASSPFLVKDPTSDTLGHAAYETPAPGMTAHDEAVLEDEIAKIFNDMKKSATDQRSDPWQDTTGSDKISKDIGGADTFGISDEDLESELDDILGEKCSVCGTSIGNATKNELKGKVYCSVCLPEEHEEAESAPTKDLAVSGSDSSTDLVTDWGGRSAIIGAIAIIGVILFAAIYIILK